MTDFNQILKEKLSKAEVPYNPDHWNEMEQMLDAQATGMSGKMKGIIGAAAVAIGVTIGGVMLHNSDSNNAAQQVVVTTQNEQVKENDSAITKEANEESAATNNVNSLEKEELAEQQLIEVKTDEITETTTHNAASTDINEVDDASPSGDNAVTLNPSADDNNQTKSTETWGKFSVSETDVCQGKSVAFSIDGIVNPVSYFWEFGDGSTSSLPNPSHVYEEVGSFDVSLTLTDIATGQDTTQTKQDLISVAKTPSLEIDWELNDVLNIDAQIAFEATGLTAEETVVWDLGDGNFSNKENFIHTYAQEGSVDVIATATNTVSGCTYKAKQNVQVINNYNLLAPTGFKPASLIPENKAFIPVGLKRIDSNHSYELEIFNPRNGMERVYRTTQYVAWNGKKDNVGEELQTGQYSWQVKIIKPDGTEKKFTGYVTLTR